MTSAIAALPNVQDTISASVPPTAHGALSTNNNATIDKTAADFESFFLSQMYGHMFDGVGQDDLSGGEQSQEVYRSWMTDQYARLTTNAGGIGVTGEIKAAMLRLQEIQNQPVNQGGLK
jgi:peptidoglycan hydrolase FlgJ